MATLQNGSNGEKSKPTLLSVERHAPLLAIWDKDEVQQTPLDDSPWTLLNSFVQTLPVGSYSKTSCNCFWLTERGFGDICFHDFQTGGIVYRGRCWTASFSEYRNVDVECSLLDILETQSVEQKYYLTPKRCLAVLRQAKKRGKQIPEPLRSIIIQTASKTEWTNTKDATNTIAQSWEH
jgi:hypothetical protein